MRFSDIFETRVALMNTKNFNGKVLGKQKSSIFAQNIDLKYYEY